MKTLNKIFMTLGVAATALGFSSCVNDLNLEPIDPNQKTDVSKDMDAVFADVYLNFATFGPNGDSPVKAFDGGMAGFQRAIFTAEEMPTDEACWLWDPGDYGTLNYGLITPSLTASYGFYSRLMINITLCNQFIQLVNDGKFVYDSAADEARAQEYVRQCKILRSGCFYYMLSFYNNPPYADENTLVGEEPTQPGRDKVYEYVTTTLEEIVSYYKSNGDTPMYGFVSLDAAEAILAKIYLNGEVFAGRNDYDKCYAHAKAIIDRQGHGGKYGTGLAPNYQALFSYSNDRFAVGNAGSDVNEILWTIPQNKTATEEHLTSWAGATFMIAAWLGTNGTATTVGYPTKDAKYKFDAETETGGVKDLNNDGFMDAELLVYDDKGVQRIYLYCEDQEEYDAAKKAFDDAKDWEKTVGEIINHNAYSFDPKAVGCVDAGWYNSGDGWKCMVARKSFVRKFEWLDPEMTKSNDTRTALWQTWAHGFTAENPSLIGDDWGKNGYLCPKYSNWAYNDDGTINYLQSPPSSTPFGGDYAVIRLAEIYLTAAEAILQGGGGSQAEALEYVNNIRERAYGANYTPWTSLSMNDLREERCRELYQENNRRTDLIRWNLWTTGYTWEWKGGIKGGTNLPEYSKSYPIPTRVMTSSHLKQIAGY